MKQLRWCATEPMGMAGTGASARSAIPAAGALGVDLGWSAAHIAVDAVVRVRKQHTTNPFYGRPTVLGDASSG